MHDNNTLRLLIPVLILLPLLYFRLSRAMKPRRLKLAGLWIRPAIMLAAGVATVAAAPPPISTFVWFVLAAAMGGVGGWFWGKLTLLHVHPEDGTLMSTGSQAGMVVLVLLVAVRLAMRAGAGMEAEALHMSARVFTDILIVFTACLFAARGLEILLRARRMMAERAAAAG